MDALARPLLPAPPADPSAEIARLAARLRRAEGPVMALVLRLGGEVEKQLAHLPPGLRDRLDGLSRAFLAQAMSAARLGRHAPDLGPAAAPMAAALAGAAGGAGGLPTALAELPVTTALILHAIAREAERQGFDTDLPAVRAECLRVLCQGSPLSHDDGVETALLGARLALSGPAVQKLVATLAPGLSSLLARTLAARAVPVLGAVSGAALNTLFLRHFRELAKVRFGLLRLAETHGAERIYAEFARAAAPPRLRRAGG